MGTARPGARPGVEVGVEVGRWVSAFLDAMSAEHGSARNTQLAYGRDLLDFAQWLAGQRLDFAAADRQAVEAYLVHCDAQGLARATRARRLSSIRQLYRFAVEEGWRADNPAQRLTGPGRAQSLPKTLSEAEVTRLIEAARIRARNPADRQRDTALFELLYATGLRVSELVGLPVAAVRGDPRMILVKGKGDKERMAPLSGPAREALAAWLLHRDSEEDARRKTGRAASRFLFPGDGKEGHLTRQYFHSLVKDVAVLAGISPARVTPHVLRHAFATHLLAHGADLMVIQTLLGHADVATTEIYTHVLEDHLRDLVLTRHPLARKTPPSG